MASVSTLGVGSGIDIRTLVDDLVKTEREPKVKRMNALEADAQAGISAFGTLSSAVAELDDALSGIADLSDFKRRKAVSGNEEYFTVSASGLAVSGNYSVEVVSLATYHKLSSVAISPTSEVGTGSLTLSVGAKSFTVTIDDSNNTLAGIQAAINSDPSNKGVTASIVTDDAGSKLVFTANESGTANQISIAATDNNLGDGNDLTRLNTAQLAPLGILTNAVFKLDGLTITRSSNTIEDALQGVSISLVKPNAANESNALTVSLDKDAVKESVTKFVEAYNSFVGITSELSKFNGPGAQNGPLFGDSTLRMLEVQLRRALTDSVSGNSLDNLTELGMTTGSDGKLTLNTKKLDKALENNFEAIGGLLSGEKGIANKMRTVARNYKGISGGIIKNRTDTLKSKLEDINTDRIKFKTKMEEFEIRLIDRFILMDQMVNSLKNTGEFMLQQLDSNNSSNK